MQAEVIFTGTELILGQVLNTNSQYLQQNLASLGIDLFYQITVGDNLERLAQAITQASERAGLIIISGGLGPTEDDLSRDALAKSLGVPLVINEKALKIMRRLFNERNVPMPDNNLRQALAPPGGIVLDNPIGTAPGIILEHNEKIYVLIPGPPNEFKLMLNKEVEPFIVKKLGGKRKIIKSRVIKLSGLGESTVDQRMGDLLQSANPSLAPTARFSEVHLRITSKAESMEKALQMNAELEEEIRQRVGEYIFGTDDETLADVVGRQFENNKITLATVEYLTGGLLANQLNAIQNQGNFYKAGFIIGSNDPGIENLIFSPLPGKEQAEQLADWGKKAVNPDLCIAVTGEIKESGKGNKLRGTIYIATNYNGKTRSGEFILWGLPRDIKERAVQLSLSTLWRIGRDFGRDGQ
ncbi:MAG: CinA family nicotinamide mononucleotide deamidase-related protein [Eubacteriales bacterium]